MRKEADFLVIGSGLAGMMFALKVAPYGTVHIVSKTSIEETNTRYAQGGIASVTYSPDTYEKHVHDTLIAGDGLCNEEVVRSIIKDGPAIIQDLIDFGANFDKRPDGEFDLAREGGHSEHRIFHFQDRTGYEIQRALTEQVLHNPNIKVFENHFAVDIITQHHLGYSLVTDDIDIECYGAYVLNPKTSKVETFLAKITYIATGGIGNVYHTTTNPTIATGDGIAMVYRAKGLIDNMEFVQFHPTALYNRNERPSFLITEAMRGYGAILRNQKGEAFMEKYDSRKELAPRDIVARAIDTEMKVSGDEHVWLDCSHIEPQGLIAHFPNIYEKCKSLGIDITKDYIPVAPAAHFVCGGIKVNRKGRTSIKHLYAGGESVASGLHGANRLASNSLLEAAVLGHRSAVAASKKVETIQFKHEIPDWSDEGTSHPEEMVLITQEFKELQQIMSNYVGIVRSNLRMNRALERLGIIWRETKELYDRSTVSPQLCELRNAINVSYLIIKMAKQRKESRGLHFTIDYPQKLKIFDKKVSN